MEFSTNPWVTETQSTLRGVSTASLKGQHARIRRAKARDNWYNTGVTNEGSLMKPFKFVDQQELGHQNSKLLSSIRSHVKQDTYMKQIHSRKKKSRPPVIIFPKSDTGASKKTPSETRTWEMTPSSEAGFEARPTKSLHGLPSYPSGSASGTLYNNPFIDFGGYGPFNRPRALWLLNFYQVQGNIAWYPEAVESVIEWTRSNVLLLFAVLHCAASHLRVVTNSSDYSEIYHYRGEAIRFVNGLLDDPIARVSNETLGGLCHLVMNEEIYGYPAAASAHRAGLQKLFELRRGVPDSSMNALVRHLLPLTNLRLPLDDITLSPRSCFTTCIPGTEVLQLSANGRKDPILDVFSWLKDTSLELPINPSATEARSSLMRVKLEYNIYSQKPHHDRNESRRCWLVAALIYLHTIIATPEHWHLLPRFETHLIWELRFSLERIMGDRAGMSLDIGVHLWILLFGGVHARGENAAWYQTALKVLCGKEGIMKWDTVKLLIKNLPWVHKDLEPMLEEFYLRSEFGRVEELPFVSINL